MFEVKAFLKKLLKFVDFLLHYMKTNVNNID